MINPYDTDQFRKHQYDYPPYKHRTTEERIDVLEREMKELNEKLDVIKNAK